MERPKSVKTDKSNGFGKIKIDFSFVKSFPFFKVIWVGLAAIAIWVYAQCNRYVISCDKAYDGTFAFDKLKEEYICFWINKDINNEERIFVDLLYTNKMRLSESSDNVVGEEQRIKELYSLLKSHNEHAFRNVEEYDFVQAFRKKEYRERVYEKYVDKEEYESYKQFEQYYGF